MFLKRIKLKNYQIYKDFDVAFSGMTFIKGRNGSGKSTLGQDALLFCLWGYTAKNLTEIPTRGIAKGCSVEVEIEHEESVYIVERKIPSELKVIKDGQPLVFENASAAQSYLKNLFGEALNFKKFHMIDNETGINFIDPKAATSFKQIMFSVSEERFNRVKEKLSKIKQEREVWNKDNAVIYPHAPSEKRLALLTRKIALLEEEKSKAVTEERKIGNEEYTQGNLIGQIQGQIRNIEAQKSKMSATNCYACGAPLKREQNTEIIAKQEANIKDLQEQLNRAKDELEEIQEFRTRARQPIEVFDNRIRHVFDLKARLEGRLKQKNFIYTTQDVEVAKQAIKELDVLSTTFLVNGIRSLEPIINEVLSKINYRLEFDINDKGKFDMKLTDKEDQVFTYKDLSTGQKLMLQIAFKLALLLERGEEGVVIADEGLGSLDHENLLHVLTIFQNYLFQLIFIIHHFDNLPDGVRVIDLNPQEPPQKETPKEHVPSRKRKKV